MISCPACNISLDEGIMFCPSCGAATPTQISDGAGLTGVSNPDEFRARLQRALGDSFELRELLGAGGFAQVFKALDTKLQREVAIKVLRPDLVLSPELIERFKREARVVAKLRHPGILSIHQIDEKDGLLYFVMPLIEGGTLRDLLAKKGKLPVDEAVRILKETASALQAAHDAGLVHRDIKPENIMLEGKELRILVMDFGIAKAMQVEGEALTQTGMAIGTPQYMSPEQAAAESNLDHRSDIYSLGVIGYQMLSGELPFKGTSFQQIIAQHITETPVDLKELVPEIEPLVSETVMKALAKDPDERWQSGRELLGRLTSVSQGQIGVTVHSRVGSRRRLAVSSPVLTALRRTVLIGAIAAFSYGTWTYIFPRIMYSDFGARIQGGWQRFGGSGHSLPWMVSVGDSLLIFERCAGVACNTADWGIFDGRMWTVFSPVAKGLLPFRRHSGTETLFSLRATGSNGLECTIFEWTGRDLQVVRRFDGRCYRKWLDQGVVYSIGSTDLLRLTNDGWVREILPDFVSEVHGFGWAGRLMIEYSRTGSYLERGLLVHDGLGWTPVDVGSGFFKASGVFGDGTGYLIEGGDESVFWVLRDTLEAEWEPKAVLPSTFTAVRGVSPEDFYLFSRRFLRHVTGGRTVVAMDRLRGGLASMALLGDVPYVLDGRGRLWSSNGDRWAVINEQFVKSGPPHFIFTSDALGTRWASNSSLPENFNFELPEDDEFVDIAVRDSALAIATLSGQVYLISCKNEEGPGSRSFDGKIIYMECETVTMSQPPGRQFSAVGFAMDERVIAIGNDGSTMTWDFSGRQIAESNHLKRVYSGRRLFPLGLDTLATFNDGNLEFTTDGEAWTVGTDFTGTNCNQILSRERCITWTHKLFDVERNELAFFAGWDFAGAGRVKQVLLLSDGRAVIALDGSFTEAEKGTVWIADADFDRKELILADVKIRDMAEVNGFLYAVGGEDFAGKIPLDSLPFAN